MTGGCRVKGVMEEEVVKLPSRTGQKNPETALSAEGKKSHRIVCHVGKELYF